MGAQMFLQLLLISSWALFVSVHAGQAPEQVHVGLPNERCGHGPNCTLVCPRNLTSVDDRCEESCPRDAVCRSDCCPSWQKCLYGRCQTPCNSSLECPGRWICKDEICGPSREEIDDLLGFNRPRTPSYTESTGYKVVVKIMWVLISWSWFGFYSYRIEHQIAQTQHGVPIYEYRQNRHTGVFRHHVLVIGQAKIEIYKERRFKDSSRLFYFADVNHECPDVSVEDDRFWTTVLIPRWGKIIPHKRAKYSRRILGWISREQLHHRLDPKALNRLCDQIYREHPCYVLVLNDCITFARHVSQRLATTPAQWTPFYYPCHGGGWRLVTSRVYDASLSRLPIDLAMAFLTPYLYLLWWVASFVTSLPLLLIWILTRRGYEKIERWIVKTAWDLRYPTGSEYDEDPQDFEFERLAASNECDSDDDAELAATASL